jgi:predicted  nucleic acid-binding Zn-ribbon protein
MLEAIEKLLILQDRDRQIMHVKAQLGQIDPERNSLHAKASSTQAGLDAAKLRGKQIESEKKRLELDVEAKKSLIEKYANQQLQTRKNEEYRALAHEIETCKGDISKIEDKEIELMEQAEAAGKQVVIAAKEAADAKKIVDSQIADIGKREENLKAELARLETDRDQLASAVDEGTRSRYERLFKNKGGMVVVGVQHGVCGGCHMKLQQQLILSCQAQQEIITCSNCGRILYHTSDMDLSVKD